MIRQLRRMDDPERIKELSDKLQYIEGEADKLVEQLIGDIYGGKYDAIRAMVIRDICELIEKVVDRCRDVGNAVMLIRVK